MIHTQDIHLSYGAHDVLKGIDLHIQEGKITAIIGSNGTGKSTLLSVISRLIKPKQGQVYLDDVDMSTLKTEDIAKRLSVLKQSNHLNLKLTVYELVSFGRFPHSRGRLKQEDHDKIAEVLEYMKLTELKDTYVDILSGGQQQRVFIAMILAQDTKYIFLDEPLNNLDMKYAVEMMLLLQKLVKELNKTIVIVMHDINIASAFCDDMVALKDGKVVFHGPSDEAMEKEILDHVFDHNFCIAGVMGTKVCVYNQHVQELIEEIKE